MSNKEVVIAWIRQLPDDVSFPAILAHLEKQIGWERRSSAPDTAEAESSAEELTPDEWQQFVAHGLREELADPGEDIYTLEDGEPVNGQG